jgi:hypothetical protein
MSWRVVSTNGLILAGVLALFAVGTQEDAEGLLPSAGICASGTDPLGRCGKSGELSSLETDAARTPGASSVVRLANAYLDRDQPGLASAVLERAPAAVRALPEVAQVEARALFGRGRAREALAVAREARDSCDVDDASTCPSWLLAKTTRQIAFLEEVVGAGIDDPFADPSATMAAYERSAHAVRLVAMR